MGRGGWQVVDLGDGALLLARPGRARMDLRLATRLPPARRARLAHQIRQDLWRALRGVRGFSPVVRVRADDGGLAVEAGGQVDGGRCPPGAAERVAAVLADPGNRRRWLARAGGADLRGRV